MVATPISLASCAILSAFLEASKSTFGCELCICMEVPPVLLLLPNVLPLLVVVVDPPSNPPAYLLTNWH